MSDRDLKNRIHRKTAIVLAVLLFISAVAYLLTGVVPRVPFFIAPETWQYLEAWQFLLPASFAIAAIRGINTELEIRRNPPAEF